MSAPPDLSSTWAVVPVKPFRGAKSRLAAVLSPEERASLAQVLLDHVLGVLREADVPALVVSRDADVLALAHSRGCQTLVEQDAGLNAAVRQAANWAAGRRARELLVVPADLPLLTSADVAALLGRAPAPRCVVLAPDRCRQGTNGLLLRPPLAMPPAFGPSSLRRHCALARRRGLPLYLCDTPGWSHDVDLPGDLSPVGLTALSNDPHDGCSPG